MPPDRDYMEGLVAEPIQTITIPLLDPALEIIKITNATYIGSYNWEIEGSERKTPTILVPGMPCLHFCEHAGI